MLRNSLLALAAFALYAPGAAAQTFYGARKAPSVSVDITVLDELGPAPNVPRALGHAIPRPAAPALQQAAPPLPAVHLRPPAASKPRKTQKSKAGPMAAEAPAPKAAKSAKFAAPEPLMAAAPPPPPVSSAVAPPPPPAPAAGPAGAPQAAPITPPVPPAPQMASRPAAAVPADTVRILFDGENTELSEAGKQALNAVVQKMTADQESRLQLVAYATGPGDQASKARRVSLSRALSVRGYLIAQGVRSTRIDVRALGHTDEQQADRVDAVLAKR